MNTQYRKNLLDIAKASKAYTDKKAQEILWKIGEYDITTQNDNTTALVKTAPSGATRVKIKRISGNCVKYAPSTASDDSVAKDKVIPENSYTTELNILGGMSYKSENLIVLNDIAETTLNGVKITPQNNNIFKLSGTCTGNGGLTISTPILQVGQTYTIEDFTSANCFVRVLYDRNGTTVYNWNTQPTASNYTTFTPTAEDSNFRVQVFVANTVVYNNDIIKPMLVKGSTAPTEYQPYFENIRDSAVSSAVLSGNLLNIENGSITTSGVVFAFANGVCDSSGTPSTTGWIRVKAITLNEGSYSYKDFTSGTTKFSLIDSSYQAKSATFTLSETTTLYLATTGSAILNAQLVNSMPMLVKGSTAPTVYKPYVAPITKTIPQEIQALTGYGWGINDTCYNYIGLVNKKFIQKVGRTFGSSYENNISIATTSAGLKCVVIQTDITFVNDNSTIIVNKNNLGLTSMGAASQWTTTATNIIACNTSKRILINFDQSLTDEQMIAKAKTLIFYYELATPIETDISSLLPADFNKIATNDNYTDIEFVSEYGYDIPNKVSYYGTIKETLCTAINKNDTLAISLANNEAKYGWSVGNAYNTRDYTINKGGQKANRYDLGTLNWQMDNFNNWITPVNSIIMGKSQLSCSCAKYPTTASPENVDYGCKLSSSLNRIVIHDKDTLTMTASQFKEYVSGLYFYYELANEVVEDITPLDNNVIEVIEDDELEFVNSENQAVPSEITYRIEVEK